MPITHEFEYAKPGSMDEVLGLLQRYPNYAILSGGTDLVDMLKENAIQPSIVVDLKGLDALKKLSLADNRLQIGAGVTFTDLMESDVVRKHFPVLVEIARTVASVGIRNRATIVGNVCSAVPCLDSGPLLRAYDGTLAIAGPNGAKTVSAEDWFVAPRKTSLQRGEIVTGVTLPLPVAAHAGCWVKLGRYTGEDLAQVSMLVLALSDGTFRVAFGAVAPVPVRARKIEKLLNGHRINPALIEQAKQLIEEEIAPITDIRASKEYRMHMAKVMFERGLRAAVSRLEGKGPKYGMSVI